MMKATFARLRAALLGLMALLAMAAAPAIAQGDQVDIEIFYRELEPHGRWVEHERYGEVWVPDVDRDWRPYTRGQWVNTDEHGWYWESDEPFGWAVYHYGRWFLDDREGWVWVPGTEWGPAWVAWRHSDEDVGWAPLPPEAEWQNGAIAHSASFYDSSRFSPAWCFVPVALLTAPRIYSHVVSTRRNSYYLGRTRFVPWQRTATPHFYNSGFDRRRWESLTGRRVDVRRVVAVDRPFRDGRGGRGGDVRVYRPRVVGLPRDDGRPGFRPPVSRRDPADRRPDFPRVDRGGRPSFDPPVSRRDPGERRGGEPRTTEPRLIDPRLRDGRPPDLPRVDRDTRPAFEPPVSRRGPPDRPLDRPADRPIDRPNEPPRVREGRPAFDPPVSRRDPAERRIDPPRGPDVRPPEPRVRPEPPRDPVARSAPPSRPPDDRRPQGGAPVLQDRGGRGGGAPDAPAGLPSSN